MRKKAAIAILVCSSWGTNLAACPFCYTETGKQVRAEIFSSDFACNVAAIFAPFPFLLAIVGAIYFGLPGRKR